MEHVTGRFRDSEDAPAPLTEGSHEILWRGAGAARLERLVTADPDLPDVPHQPEADPSRLRNVYLIGDHEAALIVDAPFDAHGIAEATQGRLIPAIVFTSGEPASTGAAQLTAEWVDGMTLLHPADLPLWRQTHGDPATGALAGYAGAENPALAAILGATVYEPSGELSDGERFRIAGCEIIARHTPGPTPGSMSFLCPEGEWAITGAPEHPIIRALPAGTTLFPTTGEAWEI